MQIQNNHKQTWWDDNLHNQNQFNTFLGWIGDYTATSKVFFRNFLKENTHFSSILDIGCGPATEFFNFKKDEINIDYMGVDSSQILFKYNIDRGVPMILADSSNIPIADNSYDIAFARHVLEHQSSFENTINEMIRVGKVLAAHIWFKKPADIEHIDYNPNNNLYHNTYNINLLNNYILSNPKVDSIEWKDIDHTESILLIWLKNFK
jgi:ubiquinone/menaquinone biosynthesis C-methylase UbiE